MAAALALLLLVVPARAQNPVNKDLLRADTALSNVQKRVALVIGNKDYADAPLKNPVNDATAMADTLQGLGFEVILRTNLSNRQMAEAVDEFAQKLDKNTIGLFYFSGHGIQVGGVNYLVPLGYKINRQADVPFEAFPAQRLLDTMGGAGCTLNLVILDACRNNPLPKSIRAVGEGGLGKMDAPSGTLVAYATAPGQTASDDPDKDNGLYTGVLLDKMKTPGLKIEEVFKATRVSVKAASRGKQTPWEESSLENDFYFAANANIVPLPVVVPGNGSLVDTKGRLKVSANAANAVVTVDGKAAPGGAFTLNLLDEATKKVQVKVVAPGYEGQLIDVTLLRGQTVSQTIVLEAIAAPLPAPMPNIPTSTPVTGIRINPVAAAEAAKHFKIGEGFRSTKKYDAAVTAFTLALEIDPTNAEIYTARGWSFRNLQQYEKAIADFTEAIRLQPADYMAYFIRGMAYDYFGKYDKAIVDFTESIRLRPDVAQGYLFRHVVYANGLKQYDKSLADYQRYMQLTLEPTEEMYKMLAKLKDLVKHNSASVHP